MQIPKLIEQKTNLDKAKQKKKPTLAKLFWVRGLFIVLAWICIILGTLGIFLPGLPTVDFYILAAFFSAKGSARLHQWFIQHRWFGLILQQWKEKRTIPKKAKIFSLLSMLLSSFIMFYTIPYLWIVYIMMSCMAGVQIWMWTKA